VLDADAGTLDVMVDPSELAARPCAPMPGAVHGWGRELFAPFRAVAGDAEAGGGIFSAYAGTAT
jgi:phosphogluconate dehydratase